MLKKYSLHSSQTFNFDIEHFPSLSDRVTYRAQLYSSLVGLTCSVHRRIHMIQAPRCVRYLGCLVDADCIIQVDVLRADEFTVSL